MCHAKSEQVDARRYSWLALSILFLIPVPSAWAFNPDAGAIAIIVADLLVTGKVATSPRRPRHRPVWSP